MMRKYILSPICSAFVAPGTGQILNQDLRKGVVLLGTAFILIIGSMIYIFLTLKSIFQRIPAGSSSPGKILGMFMQQDLRLLGYFIMAFACIWIYSVADAFWMGLKIEKRKKDADGPP